MYLFHFTTSHDRGCKGRCQLRELTTDWRDDGHKEGGKQKHSLWSRRWLQWLHKSNDGEAAVAKNKVHSYDLAIWHHWHLTIILYLNACHILEQPSSNTVHHTTTHKHSCSLITTVKAKFSNTTGIRQQDWQNPIIGLMTCENATKLNLFQHVA